MNSDGLRYLGLAFACVGEFKDECSAPQFQSLVTYCIQRASEVGTVRGGSDGSFASGFDAAVGGWRRRLADGECKAGELVREVDRTSRSVGGDGQCGGDSEAGRSCDAGVVNDKVGASQPPGKWAASNRRKRFARRAKLASCNGETAGVPPWRRSASPLKPSVGGFCETVVTQQSSSGSSCPSYDKALSDAEREARDTLAQRRAAENKVAKKLAEMKLASLEDEKKCQEYADLKHQRVIQWTNEATAKSQQSLDKVKSIDPSSSASQYEIRQQAKKLADAESDNRRLCSIVKTLSPDWQELIERKAESTFNTEYVDELMALGEAGRDNGFGY